MLNSLFYKNVSLLFRISLILGGVGSCALAIALPYYLLSVRENTEIIFRIQAVIFLAAAIGSFFWGPIVDDSKNLWRDRILTLLCELSVCILLGVFVSFKTDLAWIALFIGILSFLFVYEIVWSRVAYRTIPANRDRNPKDVSREITVTASIVSIAAPMIGTYFVMQDKFTLLVFLNLFSFIPYAIVCLPLALHEKKVNFKNIEINKAREKFKASYFKNFFKFIIASRFWSIYFVSIIFLNMAVAVIVTSLPVILFSTVEKKNEFSLPIFYLVTGWLSTFFNSKYAANAIPSTIANSCFKLGYGILLAGTIFIVGDNLIIRGFGYCLSNIFLIRINVNLTSEIYHKHIENIKGRLIMLSDFISRLSFPVVSFVLGFVPKSYLRLLLFSLFVISMVLAIILFYKMEIARKRVRET
jgi:hypothetical protein